MNVQPLTPSTAPVSGMWTPLLAPLCLAYAGIVRARAELYRRGWLRTNWLRAPVVSVGNLSAGGSGKTPIVEFLARQALARGIRPAVLTRGYGRRGLSHLILVRGAEGRAISPESLGDEPCWLAARNPGLVLGIGASRHAAGRLAELCEQPRLFVLDDGFQHLALGRQLDLLLVDAERGLGNGRVLPCGWLREPLGAARRADAVIVTRANRGDAERALQSLRAALGSLPPVFRFGYRPVRVVRLDGQAEFPLDGLKERRLNAICAIARPEGFAGTLRDLGADLVSFEARRDHDPYDAPALAGLDRRLSEAATAAPAWITTEKDAVKLRGRLAHGERMWVLEMAVEPDPAWADYFGAFLDRHGLGSESVH